MEDPDDGMWARRANGQAGRTVGSAVGGRWANCGPMMLRASQPCLHDRAFRMENVRPLVLFENLVEFEPRRTDQARIRVTVFLPHTS